MFCPGHYSDKVNCLRTGLALLLALLWLPITVHCQLESISGCELLSCSRDDAAGQGPAHQQDDCATDGCAAVESGDYRQPETADLAAESWLAAAGYGCLCPRGSDLSAAPCLALLYDSGPPELARVWQFKCRAARSPRAPTAIS